MNNKECFECGKPATEEHHIIPRVLGGTKTIPLCGGCHALVHGGYNKRRDDHVELTKAGQARARAEGKTWGFGTHTHTGNHTEILRLSNLAVEKMKVDFAESVIDKLLELRNQSLSVNDIADRLNDENIKTSRGGRWHAKSVANIFDTLCVPFRDRTLLGKLVYIKKVASDESDSTPIEQTNDLLVQS